MNEVNVAGLNAVEEAMRDEAIEPKITPKIEPKRFERLNDLRRNTVELPAPDDNLPVASHRRYADAEREAARQAHEARAAKVRETGSAEAWRDAHSQPPAETTVDQVLEQRNGVHGDFDDDASTSQDLKRIIRAGTNWEEMPAVHREALEQMMTKVGRILAGDFNHLDHWQDLQGYPRLVEKWIAANIK